MSMTKTRKCILLGVLSLWGIITTILFACIMVELYYALLAAAEHPLETLMNDVILSCGVFVLFSVIAVGVIIAGYALFARNKSRFGMVRASMAVLPALGVFTACWGWMICVWCTGITGNNLIQNQLSSAGMVSGAAMLGGPAVWFVCLLFRKAIVHMRRTLDTPAKKRGFRKLLQWLGIVFTVFSLAMLLLTLWYTFRIMSNWDEMQLEPEWYIGVIVHGAAAIIAGVELFLGIRFLLNRSHGKVPVGALLLGSSSLGFFTLWMCIANTMLGVMEGSFYTSDIYPGTILCVISQRVVCLIAILVSAWLCRRKKKNA